MDISRFDNDITQIDSNSIDDPMLSRYQRAACDHILLNDYGTSHGLHRTVKNRDKTIAGGLDHPSIVVGDGWFDELAATKPICTPATMTIADNPPALITATLIAVMISLLSRQAGPRGIPASFRHRQAYGSHAPPMPLSWSG
jgi:hypothetical protein